MPKPNSTPSSFGLIRTVIAGMVGIRGRAGHEQDAATLKPVPILITAILFMVIFVSIILTIATTVVGKQTT